MAINYENLLTQDQKKAIVENRLQQFAAEAYQTELNREIQIRQGDELASEACTASLELIESAIEVHEEELAKLEA